MANYRTSRAFPVAIILIAVAVTIAALISITRTLFFAEPSAQQTVQVDQAREALSNSSVGYSVRMYVRGEIVADEDFRSYDITITPSSRSFELYSGYTEAKKLTDTKLLNSVKAYEEFTFALEKASLLKGEQFTEDGNDLRGVCSSGQLYVFEVLNENKAVKSLWTSTCKGLSGSLDADLKLLKDLFLDQIPGSYKIVRSASL